MAAMNNYYNGTEIRLSAAFTNNGVAVDPTTVTFKVKDPTGKITPYTAPSVVKDSVGNYHLDFAVGISGIWYYRAEGTGAATVAGEAQLSVKTSQF
jgi:hypothetical protein